MKMMSWKKRMKFTKPDRTSPSAKSSTRINSFRKLSRQAAACTLCPRMACEKAVLGPGNGPIDADLMFIAEAPGRFGGARTGIPFSGDRSGDNFEQLIAHVNLTRDDMFVTNAALCNPLTDGNNSRPTAREIQNCSSFLKSTLELVRPRLVVTLGAVGLDGVNRLLGTRFQLSKVIARPQKAPDFTLLPLYHPSPRVMNTIRSLQKQKKDFQKVISLLKTA